MITTISEEAYQLAAHLPDREIKKRGPAPIKKEVLCKGLLFWLRNGVPWREVPHSDPVRRYFLELQRRGDPFKLIKDALSYMHRPDQAIIDATPIKTWRGAPKARYSGKYHNHCIKLTLSVTPNKEILDYSIDKGSVHDSKILDKMLSKCEKTPYELFLDKGYESYTRQRTLQKNNCQVRMRQKDYPKNHSNTRLKIERYFAHLKKFSLFKNFRFRKLAVFKLALWCALFLTFIT